MLIYDSQINIYLGLLLVIFKFLILLKNVIPNIYLFFFQLLRPLPDKNET